MICENQPRIDKLSRWCWKTNFYQHQKRQTFFKKNLDSSEPVTIRNQLKESGFKARVPRKKPFFSKTHQEQRLAFAKKYLKMPLSFGKKFLWTNESKFNFVKSKWSSKSTEKGRRSIQLSCIRETVKFVWRQYYGVKIDDLEWNMRVEVY